MYKGWKGLRIATVKELCSGCRTCQALCTLENMKVWNPKKAALKIIAKFPKPGEYDIKVCTECGICAKACPEEAIYKDSDVYLIDSKKCNRCGACVQACPFGVMILTQDMNVPFKCVGCGECVKYCPTNALLEKERGGNR